MPRGSRGQPFLRYLASNLCEGWSFSDASCYAPPDYSGPCAPVAHWSQLAAEEKKDLEAACEAML